MANTKTKKQDFQIYFDAEAFMEKVIKEMHLEDAPPGFLDQLKDEIELSLTERIVGTIIDNFRTEDLERFEKMMVDHPDWDEFDAVMVIAPEIPGLKEKLRSAIDVLFRELVRGAEKVEEKYKTVAAGETAAAANIS